MLNNKPIHFFETLRAQTENFGYFLTSCSGRNVLDIKKIEQLRGFLLLCILNIDVLHVCCHAADETLKYTSHNLRVAYFPTQQRWKFGTDAVHTLR